MVTRTIEKTTESLNRFFNIIFNALPKSALSIEDIIIKGNRVIVKYKTLRGHKPENVSLTNKDRIVTINSVDTLRINDGKVMEHRDMIYQINTLPQP